MTGVVLQVNVSDGGVPKTPVAAGVITEEGLYGDRQDDLRVHGGPSRAVCLYSFEVIVRLALEGHPIAPGSTGENLTIAEIDWKLVEPGVVLLIGARVVLEITSYTDPCSKNAGSFIDGDFNRMNDAVYPGESRVYARVITGGEVRRGDRVELILNEGPGRQVMPLKTYRWPDDFR